MKKTFRRLCAADRRVIYHLNQAGVSQEEIGRAIDFTQRTISKELTRNKGKNGYRHIPAHPLVHEGQGEK